MYFLFFRENFQKVGYTRNLLMGVLRFRKWHLLVKLYRALS